MPDTNAETHSLSYTLVTPARNEAANLERLAHSVTRQTVRPMQWVIVDDGSTDSTASIAENLTREYPWISAITSPGASVRAGAVSAGRRAGRDVLAFNAGVDTLTFQPDVLVKLDADVEFDPDFFERLLRAFRDDPKLGIASGTCYELESGIWMIRRVTGDHVRGATRAYRWACFTDVAPLEEQLGWDGIDEVRASIAGWQTRSVPELPFRHHRALGSRDGALSSWASQGFTSYYMGYRFSYLLFRSLHKSLRDFRALAMCVAYISAALRREPRCVDQAVRARIRSQQRLRHLPTRIREVAGR